MVVQFELENLDMKPDPEPALTDLIHAVSILNLKRGWCSAESTRLPPMSPGVRFWELALSCGSSLLFVLFSAPRGFSPRTVVFPLLKTNTSKFQFDPECSHV